VKPDREILFYRYFGGLVLKPASAKGATFLVATILAEALCIAACSSLQYFGAPWWVLAPAILTAIVVIFGALVFAWLRSEPGRGRKSWRYL